MGEMKPKQHIKKHSKITLSKRSFLQAIKQENTNFKTELREQFFFKIYYYYYLVFWTLILTRTGTHCMKLCTKTNTSSPKQHFFTFCITDKML